MTYLAKLTTRVGLAARSHPKVAGRVPYCSRICWPKCQSGILGYLRSNEAPRPNQGVMLRKVIAQPLNVCLKAILQKLILCDLDIALTDCNLTHRCPGQFDNALVLSLSLSHGHICAFTARVPLPADVFSVGTQGPADKKVSGRPTPSFLSKKVVVLI